MKTSYLFHLSSELSEGIPVRTSDDKEVGKSKKAARKAIVQVLISRICMAAPAMSKIYFSSHFPTLCFTPIIPF